jgi:hypothetical protein
MLQPLPPPPLTLPPGWKRDWISAWFVALQFRVIWLLYAGYALGLCWVWIRSRRRREPFRHGLLVAVVVCGAVFFIRSTGRSDEPHLDSVIPPVSLVVAHLHFLLFERLCPPGRIAPARRRRLAYGVAAASFSVWVFLMGIDRVFTHPPTMYPMQATAGRIWGSPLEEGWAIDRTVRLLKTHTDPGDVILNLSPTPLFHVLSGRTGPGYFDIVMLGTFLTEEDERWFVERLRADPPAAVVWPVRIFDEMPERYVVNTAPLLAAWVFRNYEAVPAEVQRTYIVMIPRQQGP